MNRAEHDYYKMMAVILKKLPKSETKKELIALTDGYFLQSLQRKRTGDAFDIDGSIRRSMLTEEDLC